MGIVGDGIVVFAGNLCEKLCKTFFGFSSLYISGLVTNKNVWPKPYPIHRQNSVENSSQLKGIE